MEGGQPERVTGELHADFVARFTKIPKCQKKFQSLGGFFLSARPLLGHQLPRTHAIALNHFSGELEILTQATSTMLPKGDACFRCRDYKLKCNGARPTCARCQRLNKECGYAPGVAKRRSKNMMLEQRALELELKVQQLSLVSTHNLLIASVRLLERIGRMNNAQVSTPEIGALDKNRTEHIISAILDHVRDARPSSGFEDLPPYLAHHFLFLPYHRHFYFFTNVPYFLACVSLPPSHPEAIHPCLLNACYLAACVAGGKAYADLQPYFIMRTRHFLDEALMFADRIMHFLWASMLLGNCLARSRRMQEWYTVVSSAAQFASACGLRLTHTPDGVPKPDDACRDEALLPPPKDEAEAIDRIRLAHSIYITDQSMTTLTALPQTFSWDMWPGNTTQRPPRSKVRSSTSRLVSYNNAKYLTYPIVLRSWRGEGVKKDML
ncbi:hypothetical protein DL93DRAFT_1327861 [Clavulina sp. PMI_390]|nr:hypothetical protein DL93DRAFT_1327861 [Clavulina sp. PMI_390]